MKAICIEKAGHSEVLQYKEMPEPVAGPGEALIKIYATGVNYIDIYFREGLYPAKFPIIPGLEGAGVIEKLGSPSDEFSAGDRVAYVGPLGSYAQKAVVPFSRIVKIPSGISFEEGAASMIQGITAHYLSRSTFPLQKGHVCLIHAISGGVGLLLCQMAKLAGAEVIGTVSTLQKAKLAESVGANYVIKYAKEDFVKRVKDITQGRGVDVVYDGVGAATFSRSLDALCLRGMCVLFGQASGKVPPFDLTELNKKGSLYVTRPGINAYISTRKEFVQRVTEVFNLRLSNQLKFFINHTYPLKDASLAHQDLEQRKTTGKIILYPPQEKS